MSPRPTLRAVVCDDDPMLRTVLGNLLRDAGLRVVGEADSVAQTQDLIDQHHVDVLLLDLALKGGNGEELLPWLTERHPRLRVVVFSAFAEHPEELLDAGADAVFDKPDFEGLEAWLADLEHHEDDDTHTSPVGIERRRPPQPAPPLPDRGPTSPSGLVAWNHLIDALDRLWPGDAILAVDVLGHRSIGTCGDPAVLADHRLALARLLSPTLRTLDRLAVAPSGVVVILLVAGHPEAAPAVFGRLEAAWDREGMNDVPVGAFGRIRPGELPAIELERVLSTLHDEGTTAEYPIRLA